MALDLEFLRSFRNDVGSEQREDEATLRFTRRALLGWAGAAALSARDVLAAMAAGPISFDVRRKRFAILVGGEERFVIDPRDFGGSPDLHVGEPNGEVHASLIGARFPGTSLDASLILVAKRVLGVWQVTLTLPSIGPMPELSLLEWLLQTQPAQRTGVAMELASFKRGSLKVKEGASIAFSPDWTISWNGRGATSLTMDGQRYRADSVTLTRAPQAAGRSFLENGANLPGSLMIVPRGRTSWATPLRIARDSHRWQLKQSDEPFEQIILESRERTGGTRAHALVFLGAGDRSGLHLRPGALETPEGRAFELPLSAARLAIDPDAPTPSSTLIAKLAEPVIAVGAGYALELHSAQERAKADLELTLDGSKIRSLAVAASVAAIGVESSEGVVQTTTLAPDALFRLTWDGQPAAAASSDVHMNITADGEAVCKIRNFSASILRPRDFLTLTFDFPGCDLVLCSSEPRVEKSASGPESVIVVRFPPQHITEQAFYEQEIEGGRDREHEHVANNNSETPQPPPVKRRISGPSRLAFEFPACGLPFTATALLDWECWSPRVSMAAQPRGEMISRKDMCPAAADETAIEAPYRLQMSPDATSTWVMPERVGRKRGAVARGLAPGQDRGGRHEGTAAGGSCDLVAGSQGRRVSDRRRQQSHSPARPASHHLSTRRERSRVVLRRSDERPRRSVPDVSQPS